MKNQTFKVLVVEDEILLLKNIVKKITSINSDFCIVGEAFNGEEALRQIENVRPDIVFTDIRMPIMDGLELSRVLYEKHPEIIIVIVSGYDDFEYVRSAMHYGVYDYLLKPVQIETLSKLLTLLREKLPPLPAFPGEDIIEELHTFIVSHYTETINLSELADKYHFNHSYLTRSFKKQFGESPLKLINTLRMNDAKKLLQDTELSVREISEKLGFSNQHYFSRIFKEFTGLNPMEYRNGHI